MVEKIHAGRLFTRREVKRELASAAVVKERNGVHLKELRDDAICIAPAHVVVPGRDDRPELADRSDPLAIEIDQVLRERPTHEGLDIGDDLIGVVATKARQYRVALNAWRPSPMDLPATAIETPHGFMDGDSHGRLL